VVLAPVFIGDGTEKTGDKTDYIIDLFGFQKRLMSAIVLDDEYPDQEKSRDDGQPQGDKVRPFQAEVHQRPKADERQEGGENLGDCLFGVRSLVFFYNAPPVFECILEM
jgi:hypothetical protein